MSGFEQGGRLDAVAPGVGLAAIVAKTVGGGCQGLSDDAVTGVLGRAAGHHPGKLLRHLTQVLYGTCTQPCCARPAHRADYEHAIPFGKGGATCLCNGDSKCDRDHQIKQRPGWHTRVIKPGIIEWTTPSGRKYTTTPAEHSA
jgi:hypothetical protein